LSSAPGVCRASSMTDGPMPRTDASSGASPSARSYAFRPTERCQHLGIRPVSQLNTQPVVSPVNASS
jgi:hypothetical protein